MWHYVMRKISFPGDVISLAHRHHDC